MEYQLSLHIVNDRILAGITVNTPRQGRKSSGLELSSEKQSLVYTMLPATLIRTIAQLVACLWQPQQRDEKRSLGYF